MRHQAHACPLVMSAGQTIRGSDSQLCPRPPPKPSKVPSLRQARGPCLLPPAGLSPSTPREHSPGLSSVAAACPLSRGDMSCDLYLTTVLTVQAF
ncbi:unnamed protein product [Boreogadus saida]